MADSEEQSLLSERLESFKADLLLAPREPLDLIRKYITTGDPVALEPATYFELRRRVADRFDLHPSAVIVVGSCKLGFSLKKKGKKRFGFVRPGSDVDVAIVSRGLFEEYWDRVFDVVERERDWALDNGKKFSRDLFCGWIAPKDLPNIPAYASARTFVEFFDEMSRERLCGVRRISSRIYRDWSRLEAYQEIMVSHCRRDLVATSSSAEMK